MELDKNNCIDSTFQANRPATDNNPWDNLGVYPTPIAFIKKFVDCIINEIDLNYNYEYCVLDLFAGDGRLGFSFSNQLNILKIEHQLQFLEVKPNSIPPEKLNDNRKYINANAFEVKSIGIYDIIISNPPYLSLNASLAKQLGFTWSQVKLYSRNLYGLGIKKGLELCKPGGYLAVIAPFGYVRGEQSSEFRNYIGNQCSGVWIRASSERNVFPGVSQDIAFHIFKKKTKTESQSSKWKFAYNGELYKSIKILPPLTLFNADKFVKVGPIVWNRKRTYLTEKREGNICIIYGGNISHNGELEFDNKRYENKQYINPKGTSPLDVLVSPFIVIRRTVRGKPGLWKIDSALVISDSGEYAGENHVITIELPDIPSKTLNEIHVELKRKIHKFYFHSGSPNISTKVVRQLFSELVVTYRREKR